MPSSLQDLEVVIARQIATVRASEPRLSPAVEAAAELVPSLVTELGLGTFRGAVLSDAKPRLLLGFAVDPAGPLGELGPEIVLKIYGDQPRGEGPLLSMWQERGLPVPHVRFGERGGCSWLALQRLPLKAIRPRGRDETLAVTTEVAANAVQMHAPAPRLSSVLRPLDTVMLPRWEAAVATLCTSGHRIPAHWQPLAAIAYRSGDRVPLHGDLGLPNIARGPDDRLVIYDASALLGPLAFDSARWAARLADDTVSPEELMDRWRTLEELPRAHHLLAAECVLEAGSREFVTKRETAAGCDRLLHPQAMRLVETAERLFTAG